MRMRRFSKLVSLAICACMMGPWQVPAAAFAQADFDANTQLYAADASVSSEDNVGIPESYHRQYLGDMYNAGQVQTASSGVTLAKDEDTGSLLVSGKKNALAGSVLTISKTFDFSENAVGHFTVNGSAQAGKKITLGFYLDDDAEPFFTTRLKNQSSEDSWAAKEHSVNTLTKNLTGTHNLSIKVESSSASSTFALNSVEFAESSVPVVNINIDESLGTIADMNSSQEHTVNCYGTLSIDVPDGYTSTFTGKELAGTNGDVDLAYIRGRGNSTWSEKKKPYKIKLDSKAGLLGMGSNKNWALMANAMDNSAVRNALTSWLGNEEGMAYTPNMEPVEVIMNDEYLGSYMLAENVRLDKNRVDIDDLDDTPDATDEATISGGYLLSLGNWDLDADKLNFTTEKEKGVFQVEAPDLYTSKNSAQFNYIKDYVQKVEDAIYEGGDYASLMDVESAAKYFWFQEFSVNGDGYTSGSCYLYKPRNGKLYWGPLWDFDLAWGSNKGGDEGWSTSAWFHTSSFWNQMLFEDEAYVAEVCNQWTGFKSNLENALAEGGMLDQLASKSRISTAYSNEKWGVKDDSTFDESWHSVTLDEGLAFYDTNVDYLHDWIEKRAQWIDEHLDSLNAEKTTVTFKDENGTVLSSKERVIGHELGTLPEVPAKEGYVSQGWEYKGIETLEIRLAHNNMTEAEYRASLAGEGMTETEIDALIEELKKGVEESDAADSDTVVIKDMVLTPVYKALSSFVKVEKIVTLRDTYYTIYQEGDESEFSEALEIPFQTLPFDSDAENMKVTSDNSDVVSINKDGEMVVAGPGDANITFTPISGNSRTIRIHVYTREEYEGSDAPPTVDIVLSKKNITISAGSYAQVPLEDIPEGAVDLPRIVLASSDESVVAVGECGMIYGAKPGRATVVMTLGDGTGEMQMLNVTVKSSNTTVGDVVKSKGLKYQVTSTKKSARTVACIGAVKTNIKSVTVPKSVKIKGVAYKVTAVAPGAFKGGTKLKKVTIGANVEIVGAKSFSGCKKLNRVVFKGKNQPKIYASAFKNVKKACKFIVPKSQKAYYGLVLKGKVVAK